MRIVLNGVDHDLSDGTTIDALVKTQNLTNRRIAVEVNGAIVPKSLHAATALTEGDRVEIVHALGGG